VVRYGPCSARISCGFARGVGISRSIRGGNLRHGALIAGQQIVSRKTNRGRFTQ
jgi:hypothetical protein